MTMQTTPILTDDILASLPEAYREAIRYLTPEQVKQMVFDAMIEAERRRQQLRRVPGIASNLTFYGANRAFVESDDRELVLSGPSETGKTIAALTKLHRLAYTYSNLQAAIIRKTYASMPGSVLKTYEGKVLGEGNPVKPYGGDKPEWYSYPNGSRVWIGGIDNPNRSLSSERDVIYVNQAEELSADDWETLSTRVTGRAGNLRDENGTPYGLLLGDCNPGPPIHWILARERAGHLKRLNSTHKHNPTLYDQTTGLFTEQGIETIRRLKALTGYRRSRLLDGLWVQAEGMVFDVWADPGTVNSDDYQEGAGDIFWCVDDGYSAGGRPETAGKDESGLYVADAHPLVVLFCQRRATGSFVVFDEWYSCLRLPEDVFAECLSRKYPKPSFAAHGPGAASLRGRLHSLGIPAHFAKCGVAESIEETRGWLNADKNGIRRVTVNERCQQLRGEMPAYAYKADGSDTPVKAFDHGPDALRYGCWVLRYERV